MSASSLHVVFIGLSVTSSWGNGHATNYRALMKALTRRGHTVTFLERDVAWYAAHRDLPRPPYGETHLYASVDELRDRHGDEIAGADLVVVGSYVPDGIEIGTWVTEVATGVTAFYDIDTPVTLADLERGRCTYLSPALVGRFDLYLSFTAGPTLHILEQRWGARSAIAFHCMVDDEAYRPTHEPQRWALGYLGTYSPDRQPALERMLLEPARRRPDQAFVVAGPQYPPTVPWPGNVERIEHLAPPAHPGFYSAQQFTLNITRADMMTAGHSPSVRLFEAAASGVPVISDRWPGVEDYFVVGREIMLASTPEEVVHLLTTTSPDRRAEIAQEARTRVLAEHTADQRARELEHHVGLVRSSVGRNR
jgi:spore maturation protein CgeB